MCANSLPNQFKLTVSARSIAVARGISRQATVVWRPPEEDTDNYLERGTRQLLDVRVRLEGVLRCGFATHFRQHSSIGIACIGRLRREGPLHA